LGKLRETYIRPAKMLLKCTWLKIGMYIFIYMFLLLENTTTTGETTNLYMPIEIAKSQGKRAERDTLTAVGSQQKKTSFFITLWYRFNNDFYVFFSSGNRVYLLINK